MSTDDLVSELVRKYETSDPFRIIELMGIFVFYAELGDTLGFFNSFHRIKMINININLNYYMRRFVCAHEMAHAILHPYLNVPYMRRNTLYSISRTECEANRLATKLLIFGYNKNDCITKEMLLKKCGIPAEMERFI